MKRRGVVLAGLVMVLGLLAIIFAVLSSVLIGVHDGRRHEALQRAARNAADSAVRMVQRDPALWEKQLRAGQVELDIASLLPVRTEGVATLRMNEGGAQPTVTIHVQIESRRTNAKVTRIVAL